MYVILVYYAWLSQTHTLGLTYFAVVELVPIMDSHGFMVMQCEQLYNNCITTVSAICMDMSYAPE